MIYVFEDYKLDTNLFELRQAGQLCKLEPQVFNVLAYLIQHRDRVITKQELLENLWPNQFISEVTLNHRLMTARKAIGDSGRAQRCIKTLHGRGYRFIAVVQEPVSEATEPLPQATHPLCPACQHQNPATAQFCVACGSALIQRCPQCEQPAPPQAVFCPACGQRLGVERLQTQPSSNLAPTESRLDAQLAALMTYAGEHKQATVLCCAIANASALLEQLDTEEMHVLRHRFYELILHQVQAYGGSLTQYLSDGCIVLFGVPVAHEDHARRAVLAAIAIQQRIQREAITETHRSVIVRLGLHTGPIIVGTINDKAQTTLTAVGNTVTLATQMQQTASSGTIQLTADTAQLVMGYVQCEEIGVTGSAPQATSRQTYRVIGSRDGRSRFDVRREGGLSRFVGRGHELELLRERLHWAKSGRGQAVSIAGEAGLGKSRLLYEFRHLLGKQEVTFWEGRCSPYGTAEAYLPLIDLLKQCFHIEPGDTGSVITDKVVSELQRLGAEVETTAPYILHLLAVEQTQSGTAAAPPEIFKQRICAALHQTLLQAAAQRPLIIALEDVHLADTTSIDFVTLLLDRMAASPILLICTYRPEFISTWSRKSYHSSITLTRLSQPESRQLLQGLLDSDQVQDALVDIVVDKSDGVPFFLEELVHTLHETGAIAYRNQQWCLTHPDAALQVPVSVHDVLMARIDRLPAGAKRVLQMGAVIGREFSWALLRTVAGVADADLRSLITALTDAELIYEQGVAARTTYLFKHALTQEVAYHSLLSTVKRRLHQQIGEAILAHYHDELEEWTGSLARHFVQAGDTQKALLYLGQSGQRALRVYANAEALHAFTQAVEILNSLAETIETRRQRVALMLRLASIHVLLGHYGESLPFFHQALEQAREAGDRQVVAHLETRIGRVRYNLGEYDAAIAGLERGLELATDINDTTRMAICYQSLGYVYFSSGGLPQAIDCFMNARRLSETTDNRSGVVVASTFLSNAYARSGHVATAVELGQHALALSEPLQDERRIAWACIMLAQAYNLSGVFSEASSLLQRALQLCDRVGDFLGRAWVHIWCGELYAIRDQDYTTALNYARHVIEMGKASGGFQHEVAHQFARGAEYLLRLDRYQEAFDYCHAGLAIALQSTNKLEYGYAYMVLAEIHATAAFADRDKVRWYVQESRKAFREVEAQVDVGRVHLAEARIALLQRDDRARSCARAARAIFVAQGADSLRQAAEVFLVSIASGG
ncbi:MAG: AAA family ATPase [bacterium]|nr:AAA family ATPase [bacterium]